MMIPVQDHCKTRAVSLIHMQNHCKTTACLLIPMQTIVKPCFLVDSYAKPLLKLTLVRWFLCKTIVKPMRLR